MIWICALFLVNPPIDAVGADAPPQTGPLVHDLEFERAAQLDPNAQQIKSLGYTNTPTGRASGPNSDNLSNTLALGDSTTSSADNQTRNGEALMSGIGRTVGRSAHPDRRARSQATYDVPGLSFVRALRPVTYQLDRAAAAPLTSPTGAAEDRFSKLARRDDRQFGVIAQQVEKVAQGLGFAFSGIDARSNSDSPHARRYNQFVAPLVMAVREQDAQLESMRAELNEMRGLVQTLQAQIEDLE